MPCSTRNANQLLDTAGDGAQPGRNGEHQHTGQARVSQPRCPAAPGTPTNCSTLPATAHSPDAMVAAGARRGANRDGPHRSVLRPPARRHHPGRGDPGQGSGRRAAGARRGANRDGPHRSVLRPPARRHHPGRGDPGCSIALRSGQSHPREFDSRAICGRVDGKDPRATGCTKKLGCSIALRSGQSHPREFDSRAICGRVDGKDPRATGCRSDGRFASTGAPVDGHPVPEDGPRVISRDPDPHAPCRPCRSDGRFASTGAPVDGHPVPEDGPRVISRDPDPSSIEPVVVYPAGQPVTTATEPRGNRGQIHGLSPHRHRPPIVDRAGGRIPRRPAGDHRHRTQRQPRPNSRS